MLFALLRDVFNWLKLCLKCLIRVENIAGATVLVWNLIFVCKIPHNVIFSLSNLGDFCLQLFDSYEQVGDDICLTYVR